VSIKPDIRYTIPQRPVSTGQSGVSFSAYRHERSSQASEQAEKYAYSEKICFRATYSWS
jgi:hypothetical protein